MSPILDSRLHRLRDLGLKALSRSRSTIMAPSSETQPTLAANGCGNGYSTVTKNTKYVVKQAHSRAELDAIMDVIWAANYEPYEPFAQIIFPVLGFTPKDKLAAITESKERFWTNHQSEPSSNWIYVEEKATGSVVGSAQWEIFEQNPFPDGPPKLTAPWWPEGEYRRFCELLLNLLYKPRANWMTRPHLALNWMAVDPFHRRQGLGSMLMTWGITRADALNVECWLEASHMGKPLYEKFNYRAVFKLAFDTEKKDASNEWRRAEYEMTPMPVNAMWRPKSGIWEKEGGGEWVGPWELGYGKASPVTYKTTKSSPNSFSLL